MFAPLDKFEEFFYEYVDKAVKIFPGGKMNFYEAVQAMKNGFFVRRPNWDKSMQAWWTGKFVAHSTKYDAYQQYDPDIEGYIYVCERDDAEAIDWERSGYSQPKFV